MFLLPDGIRLSVSEPLELRRDVEPPSGNWRSILRGELTLIKNKNNNHVNIRI